eukprot:TRINITY_DN10329_c0_g1_i1.p1 TRINITY_DN10329_c0_g1~~TRINITY_DN10329_c0_g1_i1.p1  ORF type:complete len:879 (+),score=178.62 TRINITY_DN10329_c0_g1_i1:149-2785(+)
MFGGGDFFGFGGDGNGFSARSLLSGENSERPLLAPWFGDGVPPREDHRGERLVRGEDQPDIVQFAQEMHYALEGEDLQLEIDIMRIGDCRGPCSIECYTEDGSAQAGSKYVAKTEMVTFQTGEDFAHFSVNIIDDPLSDATLEFKVRMRNPKGCQVAMDMDITRIKIIDDDRFPSELGAACLDGLGDENISDMVWLSLMREYIWRNFNVPGVSWRTVIYVTIDQMHNLYFLLKTFLNIYMVDCLFSSTDEAKEQLWQGSRWQSAIGVVLGFAVPFLLLRSADVVKLNMDLEGLSTEFLVKGLFRRYLCWDESSLIKVPENIIVAAIVQESLEIVCSGYLKMLSMIRILGKFVLVFFFLYRQRGNRAFQVLIFPLVGTCMVHHQFRQIMKRRETVSQEEHRLSNIVHKTASSYEIVVDYRKRPAMTAHCEDKVRAVRKARVASQLALVNLVNFYPGLSVILVSACILLNCNMADDTSQSSSVGKILAMIGIYFDLGEEFKGVSDDIIELLGAIEMLKGMTDLMNMPLNLQDKRILGLNQKEEMVRRVHQLTHKKVRKLAHPMGQKQHGHLDIDELPFTFTNVKFEFMKPAPSGSAMPSDMSSKSESSKVSLTMNDTEIKPGAMIAIIGGQAAGKATLLDLICGKMSPTTGTIFIPCHYRVLRVTSATITLEASLWENLTFGTTQTSDQKALIARVRGIILRLGLVRPLKLLDEEIKNGLMPEPVQHGKSGDAGWWSTVSAADLAGLHLARALVANSEVLCLHHPMLHYNEHERDIIMNMLAEYVEERGCCLDGPKLNRRPRSIFYTARNSDVAKLYADKVFEIKGGGVSVLPGAAPLRKQAERERERKAAGHQDRICGYDAAAFSPDGMKNLAAKMLHG